MATQPVGGSPAAKPTAPQSETRNDAAPKKNTGDSGKAAKTAPDETKAAVNTTFGPVPGGGKQSENNAKNSHAKEPENSPKAPENNPKAGGDAKTPAAPDAKAGAPDPDAKLPITVDPKLDPNTLPKSNLYGDNDPKHSPGDYAKTADGKDYAKTADGKFFIKYNENNNAVAIDAKNNVVQDANGNAYALNDKASFATTADKNQDYIVYDKTLGGNAVAIDYIGKPVSDWAGNPKVVNREGTYAKTVDGKEMVYPKESGGKMAVSTPGGKSLLLRGPQDQIYLVKPDGQYALTVDGKYMAYGKGPDDKFVAISGGNVSTDKQGRPYTLNADGSYMQPGPSQFGVLNQYNKIVASDAATGEVARDVNGNAYVLDGNGKFMQPEPGKFAVYNEQTGKTIVNGDDGKAYLVNDDGKYAKKPDGSYDVYTPKLAVKDLAPVSDEKQAQITTPEGLAMHRDRNGKYVGVTNTGLVVEIDQTSGNMVTDPATGAPIVLNDPYAERTPARPNMSVIDTLDRLPQGTERGDPMAIKNELFKNGLLDKESLYAALGKYDVRDVYDALINSSRYGGWNNAPQPQYGKLVHPDEPTARALITAMIAWQNDNAPYAPMKEGELPLVQAVSMFSVLGVSRDKNAYVNVDAHKDFFTMVETAYHELNHATTSEAFEKSRLDAWISEDMAQGDIESVTEYLSNRWTQNSNNSAYDSWGSTAVMDKVARELGGGDVYAGTDILKRAYYQGDPVALKLFDAAYAKHSEIYRDRPKK